MIRTTRTSTVRLRVASGDAPPAALAVRFTADQRVADLAAALGARTGERLALPDGRVLEPAAPILDAPLRAGDLVRLVDERYRPDVAPVAALELRVVAGPNAGLRHRLLAGAHALGRGQCDLRIPDDPAMSRLHAHVSVREGEAFIDRVVGRNGIRRNGEPLAAPCRVQPGEVLEAGRSLLTVTAASSPHRAPGRGGALAFVSRPRRTVDGDAPDPCELADRARLCLPGLWERRPAHPDFLRLRTGWANWPDPGRMRVRHAVPVSVDLAAQRVLAVTGDEAARLGLARWLVVQAAVLHRPSELRIGVLAAGDRAEWDWLDWLPHRDAGPAGAAPDAHRLLIVAGDAGLDRAPLEAPGLHVLWLGAAAPPGVTAGIHIEGGVDRDGVVADSVSAELAAAVARDLAGIEEAPCPPPTVAGDEGGFVEVTPLGGGEPPAPAPSGERTALALRLTVEAVDRARDVLVEVDSDRTAGELAAALTGDGDVGLRVARTGRVLAGALPVGASGLRSGDVLTAVPDAGPAPPAEPAGPIDVHRPPRVARRPPEPVPEPGPAPRPGPTLDQVLQPLLPVGVGAVLGIALGAAGYFASGRQLTLLLFVALGPMMGVVSGVFPLLEVLGRRRAHREGQAAHEAQVATARAALARRRADEARDLHAASPGPDALLAWPGRLDPRLWERDPSGADWLRLRAGLTGVPLAVDLPAAGALGLCGPAGPVEALARWLVLQTALLHSPRDVAIAAAVPDAVRERWAWLGWLPHVHTETAPVPGRLVVSDADPTAPAGLLRRLLALVDERRAAGAQRERTTSVVVLLHQAVALPAGEVAHLLAAGPAQGVHPIWVGGRPDRLPREVGALLHVDHEAVELVHTGSGERTAGTSRDDVSMTAAETAARALAPLRDPAARGPRAGVPRHVTLAELLDLRGRPEAGIRAAWERDLEAGGEGRDLRAPLGIAAGHREFSVSIRRDGPHGLVGGMTGAGKSELLQTLVASLAARHSPQALNFLLIDYKGGAAFNACVDLPHTVGCVTDLDGRLVNRALTSMRAELARRERIQGDAGVKDLEEFERLQPEKAPPSLLIVVDEFAALAAELPDFVEGMVDIAQRGRSLGIHLLLATQRPAGVIGPKIRANTPLRLSLRFKDESDSEDVLKRKDAARPGLPPGRAFTVTGAGELVEFQCGYAGAHALAGPEARIRVRDLDFGGVPVRDAVPAPAGRRVETDLRRLVRAMAAVSAAMDLAPPHRPWLTPLPDLLPLATLPPVRGWRGPAALIGLLDEPRAQSQTPLSFPLQEEGSLLVFGGSGSGKTTLLRTLAVSAAEAAPPSALNLHVLDFATRQLGSLAALPHCAGVVMGDEPARAVRLVAWLQREAERRRALLGAAGAPTLAECAGPDARPPHLLVLIDGYPALAAALEAVDMGAPAEALRNLLTAGRPLGMAFALTADRTDRSVTALRAGRRVVLRAGQDDLAAFGLPRSLIDQGELEPGRGYTFTANPRAALEVQCAVAGDDPAGGAQAWEVAAAGDRLRARHGAVSVPRIETLPIRLDAADLPAPDAPLAAVIGAAEQDEFTVGPAVVDLGGGGHFVVSGPPGSGRTGALAAFAHSLRRASDPPPVHLLSHRPGHPLADRELWSSAALGEAAGRELLTRLAEGGAPAVLCVDDGEELLAGLGTPELDRVARAGAVRIVIAIDAQRELQCRAWATQVARVRHGLVLSPGFGADGAIAGQPAIALPPSRTPLPRGRGYLVRGGRAAPVQIALTCGRC